MEFTDIAGFDAHRHTIDTRLGPVSYVDVGEGPAALFVHGVATNAYLWRGVIDGVRDVRRCIAPDLPLHGRTPAAPDQDFSVGGLADVVVALLDALDGGGLGPSTSWPTTPAGRWRRSWPPAIPSGSGPSRSRTATRTTTSRRRRSSPSSTWPGRACSPPRRRPSSPIPR